MDEKTRDFLGWCRIEDAERKAELMEDALKDPFRRRFYLARIYVDDPDGFAFVFGERLAAYTSRARKEGHADMIRCYELETYGVTCV